jgi:hypothetical protein
MMKDVEFCKQQLPAIVVLARPETVGAEVKQFLKLHMPKSGPGRAALAAWALRKLRAAEQTPGSGISTFVPPADLREVSIEMKMLHAVLSEIETVHPAL